MTPVAHAVVEHGTGNCKGCGEKITRVNAHAVYKYAEDKHGVMTRTTVLWCGVCCPSCCPKPLVPPLASIATVTKDDPPLQIA
jgi:hypothetical protein